MTTASMGGSSGAVRLIYVPSELNLLIERRVHRVLCLSVVEFRIGAPAPSAFD